MSKTIEEVQAELEVKMTREHSKTWNDARHARDHVGAALDAIAAMYGALLLDTEIELFLNDDRESDGFLWMLLEPIERIREELRAASCHMTDVMVDHKEDEALSDEPIDLWP